MPRKQQQQQPEREPEREAMSTTIQDAHVSRRAYDKDRRRWVITPPPITGLTVWRGSSDR